MNAAQLMIGDLVKTNKGDIIKVESISTKRQHRKVGYHTEESCTKIKYVRQGQIGPIPLTEDILKANGFENSILHTEHVDKVLNLINSKIVDKDGICMWHLSIPSWIRLPIRYVHELQRALRVCGLTELADNMTI